MQQLDLWDRRGFLKKSMLATLATALGTELAFAESLPKFHLPLALAASDPFDLKSKVPEMRVLSDRPWNVETPAHLLDDAVTPADRMFVRNNGLTPQIANVDAWTLTIDGESVPNPKTFSLEDLKKRFAHHTYRLTIECGGNGRYEYNPPGHGNQWQVGAVSCAAWTGVRLKDVLREVGFGQDAVYIGYYGRDVHLSGDPNKEVISRGVPMHKALEDETLLAWQMNGQDIPLVHGYPLRLVIGGWPGSVSGKWLYRIAVRNQVHDGQKMTGTSYRVPAHPVAPGTDVPDEDLKIIESMPVKSLITYPKTGAMLSENQTLAVRGHAWAGDHRVQAMHTSIDYGATWQPCTLQSPPNRLAWQQWNTTIRFPQPGYYEVWARATDDQGVMQPMVVPAWNPGGYVNNACHRIAVKKV
ncbi:DMSO/TMAO reductase YedYZ, molybdopterin-dependent catalytic subunit [Catalinimonas alkaloidigena]|uniref:DMSO/TMAO reductase YedYZ, molybdopterin-dependent catalytic subunit n=1 Tax=Catalinimonas alkaloidigena TaxID=1075417 RepID=A0A1G9R6P9_9BACT|nr:sulfite oxidase [Catalinimonas alkaloidigena]SDM18982.1 DMSO/TMAO reductase YedYZ, molybdopterin-dependent catalytic subunit [Catalinimonas alkaloidigena]